MATFIGFWWTLSARIVHTANRYSERRHCIQLQKNLQQFAGLQLLLWGTFQFNNLSFQCWPFHLTLARCSKVYLIKSALKDFMCFGF